MEEQPLPFRVLPEMRIQFKWLKSLPRGIVRDQKRWEAFTTLRPKATGGGDRFRELD